MSEFKLGNLFDVEYLLGYSLALFVQFDWFDFVQTFFQLFCFASEFGVGKSGKANIAIAIILVHEGVFDVALIHFIRNFFDLFLDVLDMLFNFGFKFFLLVHHSIFR